MKNKHALLAFAAAALVACSTLTFTGCESISNFKEEHPVAFDALEGAAKVALQMKVADITDDVAYQNLLNSTIDVAFLAASTPEGVASELQDGVANVYPDDALMQQIVVSEFVQALTAPEDPTVPASGAGVYQYKQALADALAPDVSYDYTPDLMLFALDNPRLSPTGASNSSYLILPSNWDAAYSHESHWKNRRWVMPRMNGTRAWWSTAIEI